VAKDGHETVGDLGESRVPTAAVIMKAIAFLSAALPLPAPYRMYGEIGAGKRIVSLHYFGICDDSTREVSYDGYSLGGTGIPQCSQKHASGKHYRIDLVEFWRCVQQRKVVNIGEAIKRSNRPTLSIDYGGNRFILTDAAWTGVEPEALYRHLGLRNERATVKEIRTGESHDLRKQGLEG
jgi:hypothetical protein